MAGQRSNPVFNVDDAAFVRGFQDAMADFKVESKRDLVAVAVTIENRAKELCPVDTGRLRSSIGHEEGSDNQGYYVDVGTNVAYAPYVEFGTSKGGPQPFLRPAVAEAVGYGGGTAAHVTANRARRKR